MLRKWRPHGYANSVDGWDRSQNAAADRMRNLRVLSLTRQDLDERDKNRISTAKFTARRQSSSPIAKRVIQSVRCTRGNARTARTVRVASLAHPADRLLPRGHSSMKMVGILSVPALRLGASGMYPNDRPLPPRHGARCPAAAYSCGYRKSAPLISSAQGLPRRHCGNRPSTLPVARCKIHESLIFTHLR
jgi:hypothetical protein